MFALAVGGPTLRLSGVYLAIATIGLGEVLRAVYLNMDAFGGALGLSGIPERAETWMIFGLLAAAIAVLWLVARSRVGRAMEAMREDEMGAQVMGVNVPRYRMGALLVSSTCCSRDRRGANGRAMVSSHRRRPASIGFDTAVGHSLLRPAWRDFSRPSRRCSGALGS